MSDGEPKFGQVVRYAYLWHSEAKTGRDEGAKDRPCVITYCKTNEDGTKTVAVSPITHSPQVNERAQRAIPIKTAARLGLDNRQSYIVTDQYNRFTWPGPDLRPADPKQPGKGSLIGRLPRKLAEAVRDDMISNTKARHMKDVGRDTKPDDRAARLKAQVQNIKARQETQKHKEKEPSK